MIYGIDKKTKEHRLVTDDPEESAINNPGFSCHYVEADAEGWIPWSGGECPMPDGAPHEVKWADGNVTADDSPNTWDWSSDSTPIVAYRPILYAKPEAPEAPEAPEWDGGMPPVGTRVQFQLEGEHFEGEVIAHRHGNAVVEFGAAGTMYQQFHRGELRPIRSDLDRAVDETIEAISRLNTEYSPDRYTLVLAYRAGLRFPSGA